MLFFKSLVLLVHPNAVAVNGVAINNEVGMAITIPPVLDFQSIFFFPFKNINHIKK
jgi:hypothetical protein